MTEIWKEIEDWPGYEVSNTGKVRCWNPRNRHAFAPKKARMVKPTKSKGYFTVKLSCKGKKWTFQIHGLVLNAFKGKRPENAHGRHLDGNPENNDLSNLEWGTISENQRDRIRHNTHMRGERHVNSKLTTEKVVEIKNGLRDGTKTYAELADMFGVSISTISFIKQGKNWGWLKEGN
jgi:hypothetical protein